MESRLLLLTWFKSNFKRVTNDSEVDFISRNGRFALEMQAKPQGLRGVYLGVVRLARDLEVNPNREWGCLVVNAPELNREQLQQEWIELRRLFTDKIGRRLAIVAKTKGELWIEPRDPSLHRIGELVEAHPDFGFATATRRQRGSGSSKGAEILKVLMLRWLFDNGPLRVGQLAAHVGCTYATVRKALLELKSRQHLQEQSSVLAELRRFPAAEWNRIVALAPKNRPAFRYIDRSGQPVSFERLMSRLEKCAPPNVAFGGVIAARHWQPTFDLNGIPRLDVVIHGEPTKGSRDFLAALDPALQESSNPAESAVVVIHYLTRQESDFTISSPKRLPIADPIETALDLMELGLVKQAHNLFAHFRREIPPL